MSKQQNKTEWKIEYNDEMEVWLNELTDDQLKSVAKELRLLELSGNLLRLPHSRSLQKGLFELRERRFGYRMYYVFQSGGKVLLLHAGTKATQEKDIKLARKWLDALRNDDGGE